MEFEDSAPMVAEMEYDMAFNLLAEMDAGTASGVVSLMDTWWCFFCFRGEHFPRFFLGGHVGAFLCILWQRYGRCVVMDVWSYQISKVSALFSAWCCYEEWFVGLMIDVFMLHLFNFWTLIFTFQPARCYFERSMCFFADNLRVFVDHLIACRLRSFLHPTSKLVHLVT